MEWLRKLRGKSVMIKQIDHAAIVVSDMDRAFEFYSVVLGLDVILDGRKSGGQKKSFLGAKKQVILALTEDKNRTSADTASVEGVNHIAFLVGDLEKSSRLLKERGVSFIEEKKDSDGKITAYHFLDPDGLELEICAASENEVPQY
jgi:lactoylglutathione lyase